MIVAFCIAAFAFAAWFGYAESQNPQKFNWLKTLLGPLWSWAGFVDEPERGLIFRQTFLMRVVFAAVIGIIAGIIDAFLLTNPEGGGAYLLLREIDMFVFVALATFVGFVFSYLWKPASDSVAQAADQAIAAAKEVAPLPEKEEPETPVLEAQPQPEPEKVEVKKEEEPEEEEDPRDAIARFGQRRN
jgi:hypothetical protein